MPAVNDVATPSSSAAGKAPVEVFGTVTNVAVCVP
jgi:hypothetical protein